MDTFTLEDKSYPLLNPIEEYLALRYGSEWRTPATEKVPWQKEAANLVSQ